LAAWLGRWTSADPIGIGADGPGLYNYTRGSPVNYTDPSGTERYSQAEADQRANNPVESTPDDVPVVRLPGGTLIPDPSWSKREREPEVEVTPAISEESAHQAVRFMAMGEGPRDGGTAATGGMILANWLFLDIKPNAGDWGALGKSKLQNAIGKRMEVGERPAKPNPEANLGPYRKAGTQAAPETPPASVQPAGGTTGTGGQPPTTGGGGSSGGPPSGTGKAYVSGFQEIMPKARAARAGDVQALGEIQAAKTLRSEGQNVHFQTPVGKRGPGTADFLVSGQRGTGVGGKPTDVLTPRTKIPANVALGVASKNDQAPYIIVNIRNNPHLSKDALGGEAGLMQGARDLIEPAGGIFRILGIRIFD